MLNYSTFDETVKLIAIYYSQKIHNPIAVSFFSGQKSISSSSEAIEIANCFWKMSELAANDHLNERDVLNGVDTEFWMHKLFNKVYGYYDKNGFIEEWKSIAMENL